MKKEKENTNIFESDYFLASYAQKNCDAKERKHKEIEDKNRTQFQRDRDRIIHTTAFRRLQGKTQVVPPLLGDHFRNRLTHTIEVAQIARDLSRSLKLNEDLTEAIALAHDLGHTPFGHAGEQALNGKMQEYGFSFEHNEQSLRIVEIYESRYQNFRGLNLTFEVREGMQKHSSKFSRQNNKIIYSPHLESQVVDISDEIAYLSADLEDALRGGFFEINDLKKLKITSEVFKSLPKEEVENRSSIVRRIIKILLEKIIEDSLFNIKKYKIKTLESVQQNKDRIIQFEESYYKDFKLLKKFLYDNYYTNEKIEKECKFGQKIIKEIFDFLIKNPEKIPNNFMPETQNKYQKICDYIAGMTDNFAKRFYKDNIKKTL